MKATPHAIAGGMAGVMIATFWLSTVLVELLASEAAVATVKHLTVVPGLFILIPALAAAGGSGFLLARGRRGQLVDAKMRRMPVIALNGIVILVPCAIVLDHWAAAHRFDALFYAVQAIELLAGGVNLAMIALNLRDGLRLTGRIRLAGQGVPHVR